MYFVHTTLLSHAGSQLTNDMAFISHQITALVITSIGVRTLTQTHTHTPTHTHTCTDPDESANAWFNDYTVDNSHNL